jgi:hypothetical protein
MRMRSLKYRPVAAILVVLSLTEIYGSPVTHVPTGTWLPNPISMSDARSGATAAVLRDGQTRREKEN